MRRVLLIDAVEFSPERAAEPWGSVPDWFRPHLPAEIAFSSARAGDPDLRGRMTDADALIVSGSPRDAWSDDPAVTALGATMLEAVHRGQPLLGVCYGHQLLARVLGGEVRRNPPGWEVGVKQVELTEAGKASPLFTGLGSPVEIVESHRDAVLALPPRAVLLATNEHTPIQAFQWGPSAYGVQFHPEMNGEILRALWRRRREDLRAQVAFDLDAALDSAAETPAANRLFHNFLQTLPA